jgi:uncharacterized membrane protein YphA (DoxX/SURF4 family)
MLLRISVAVTFVVIFVNRADISSVHLFFAGPLLLSLCLIIGVLTPYLSFIVCVYALVNLFGGGVHLEMLIFGSLLLNSAALALLGPGAYSIDARLFGRRVVVVPPRKNHEIVS